MQKIYNNRNSTKLHLSNSTQLRLLGVMGGASLILFSLILGTLFSTDDIQITLTSGNIFLVDNNKGCAVEPNAAYVSYEICNTSDFVLENLTVVLEAFTNPQFGLAGGQSPVQYIDAIAIGECQTLYWYTYYDCSIAEASSDMTIKVSDEDGNMVSQTENFYTYKTIDAGAGGKILSSNLVVDTVIGAILNYEAEYSLGSLGSHTPVILQPAGNKDFDAGCFQLVGAEVIYSEVSDIQVGDTDQLFYGDVSKHSGSGHVIRMMYYFRNECSAKDTTVLKGYSGAVSGTNFKRYNLGEDEMDNFASLPIEWYWMKAQKEGSNAKVSWGAGGNVEGEFYTIERSSNGVAFESIAQELATDLRIAPDEYAFVDDQVEELESNSVYYRLKHTDLEGEESYSTVQELRLNSLDSWVDVFPNPARDHIQVVYTNKNEEASSVRIVNLAGQEMYTAQFGFGEGLDQRIELDSWPAGTYFLELESGNQQAVKTFVKR